MQSTTTTTATSTTSIQTTPVQNRHLDRNLMMEETANANGNVTATKDQVQVQVVQPRNSVDDEDEEDEEMVLISKKSQQKQQEQQHHQQQSHAHAQHANVNVNVNVNAQVPVHQQVQVQVPHQHQHQGVFRSPVPYAPAPNGTGGGNSKGGGGTLKNLRRTPGASMHRSAFEKTNKTVTIRSPGQGHGHGQGGTGRATNKTNSDGTRTADNLPFNSPSGNVGGISIDTGAGAGHGPGNNNGRRGRDVLYTPSAEALLKNKDLFSPGTKRDAFSPNTMQLTSNIDQLLNDEDEVMGQGTGSGDGGSMLMSSPNSRTSIASDKEPSLIHEATSFGGESHESGGLGFVGKHHEDWYNSFTLDNGAGTSAKALSGNNISIGSGKLNGGNSANASISADDDDEEELFRPKQLILTTSLPHKFQRTASDVSSTNSTGSTSSSSSRRGGKGRPLNFNANTSASVSSGTSASGGVTKLQHPRVTKASSFSISPTRQTSTLKQSLATDNSGGKEHMHMHLHMSQNMYGSGPMGGRQGNFGFENSHGHGYQQQFQPHGQSHGYSHSIQSNPQAHYPPALDSNGHMNYPHPAGHVSPHIFGHVSPIPMLTQMPYPSVSISPIPIPNHLPWIDQELNVNQRHNDWGQGPGPGSMNQGSGGVGGWDPHHPQQHHQHHQHPHPQQPPPQMHQQLSMQHIHQHQHQHHYQIQHQHQQQMQHHHQMQRQEQMQKHHIHHEYNPKLAAPSPPLYQTSQYHVHHGNDFSVRNRRKQNMTETLPYRVPQKKSSLQQQVGGSQISGTQHSHSNHRMNKRFETQGKYQSKPKSLTELVEQQTRGNEGSVPNGSTKMHHHDRLSSKESKTKIPKQEKVLSDSSMKRMNKENQNEGHGESVGKLPRGKKGNRKGNSEEAAKDLTPEEKQSELKRAELIETPQVRSILKDFYRKFRLKEKETLASAADFARSCLGDDDFPKNVHWRIVLELADLAKRANNFQEARSLYHKVCELQPFASQGWLERSKLEEECGELLKCSAILNEGLKYCPYNENLRTRAIKHEERMAYELETGDLRRARELLAPLKHNSIDKVWRTVLEGALMEARAGREVVARRVLKYLMKWVSWYGPLYLEAFRLERDCDRPLEALEVVERGLKEIPRYGPLWFGAFRICEGLDIASGELHLPRTLSMIDRAIKSISRELTWKVQMEAAQAQERAAHIAVSKDPSLSLNERLTTSRKYFAKTIFSCPENLCWKVWLAAGRMELSAGRFDEARLLFLKSFSVVPTKGRPSVLLECVRLEEFVGNMALAKAILCKTRSEAKADWKVWLQSVSLEVRSGNRELAIQLAQKGLMEHSGTGRLWATLVQLREPDGERQQMNALKKALRAVPKSGEVWCEAARMHLNPFSPCFDLETASNHLEFATKFTPQYGDSFLETLRQVMIQSVIKSCAPAHVKSMKSALDASLKDQMLDVLRASIQEATIALRNIDIDSIIENLDSGELELRCSNADPNYGKLWFHSRLRPSDTARTVLKRAKQVIWNDLGRFTYIYVAASMRQEAVKHISKNHARMNLVIPKLDEIFINYDEEQDIKLLEGISKADFVTGFVEVNHEVDLQTLNLFDRRKILFGSDLLLTWKPLN